MQSFIVSNHEATTVKVRHVLLREGHDCPTGHVLSLELAAAHLAQAQAELLVLVLSPDPEVALATLLQLRVLSQARILAVGPATESRLVLAVLRAGADDYVDEADLEGELVAALARGKSLPNAQGEPGRTIAILSPNGGTGSSTMAVNIATTFAKDHQRALLVDLKLEAGDVAALLDLKPTHTLAELCLNAARMDRVMFERSLVAHANGVSVLAPPRTFADIHHVTADGVRQALALGRSLFPYVVIDLDHSFRDEQIQVLRQADVILLVMRLDFTSVRNIRRTLDHLDALKIDRNRVRLVVNRYGQPKEVPPAKAEEVLGLKISHYIPEDAKTINRANNSGVPVVLDAPSAKVSKSLMQLAASINGRHKK